MWPKFGQCCLIAVAPKIPKDNLAFVRGDNYPEGLVKECLGVTRPSCLQTQRFDPRWLDKLSRAPGQ